MTGAIEIRFATADDCPLLLELVRLEECEVVGIARHERQIPNLGLADRPAEIDLARLGDRFFRPHIIDDHEIAQTQGHVDDGEPAGAALFHSRFSTWLGRPGLYLEDLFVVEEARGNDVGRRLMARLAAIAVERGWGRIDFHVLDWNPARKFYHRLGMGHLGEWLRYGADEAALKRLAKEDK